MIMTIVGWWTAAFYQHWILSLDQQYSNGGRLVVVVVVVVVTLLLEDPSNVWLLFLSVER